MPRRPRQPAPVAAVKISKSGAENSSSALKEKSIQDEADKKKASRQQMHQKMDSAFIRGITCLQSEHRMTLNLTEKHHSGKDETALVVLACCAARLISFKSK